VENATIIIPARKGSKGFPGKNRYLFDYAVSQIPHEFKSHIVFTSDDDELLARAFECGFQILEREPHLSTDETSMGSVISDVVDKFKIDSDRDIITLYPTYPQRTWEQVEEVYTFYKKENARSLLCAKDVKTHPYMCFERTENFKGKKVIDHDLYRRQEYPECFEACHYIVITKANVLGELDNNLHCDSTVFYPLHDEVFDVDYMKDFDSFRKDSDSG
jgi:CMP-N-acetylneuraminic acid synthetase|tara:strand:+ start:4857 stop:5510 length:654 start_codon:yes stop_codon:yes gene_type:complete